MVLYREHRRNIIGTIGKWLIAILIFVAVMTVTWDNVDGFSLTSTRTTGGVSYPSDPGVPTPPVDFQPDQGDNPESVPEPTTLILLGSGLGLVWMVRRNRKG